MVTTNTLKYSYVERNPEAPSGQVTHLKGTECPEHLRGVLGEHCFYTEEEIAALNEGAKVGGVSLPTPAPEPPLPPGNAEEAPETEDAGEESSPFASLDDNDLVELALTLNLTIADYASRDELEAAMLAAQQGTE